MRPKRATLFFALAVCAVLYAARIAVVRTGPAYSEVPAQIEGNVVEGSDGWHPGEPFVTDRPVRAWGTWNGSDEHTGRIVLGPLRASAELRLGVGGYPSHEGIQLFIERVDNGERIAIQLPQVGERWQVVRTALPREWRGQSVRIVAVDEAKQHAGWVAITEPVRGGRDSATAVLLEALNTWAINGLLLGVLGAAALGWIAGGHLGGQVSPDASQTHPTSPAAAARNAWVSAYWIPLLALAVVATAGYIVFWAFFASALVGKVVAGGLLFAGLVMLWRAPPLDAAVRSEALRVARLSLVIGLFSVAILHLFPTSLHFYHLAANRFHGPLPSDNELPYELAARLLEGLPARQPDTDWLSSDRPPLQTGWQLITLPLLVSLKLDPNAASGTAGIWFQLAWVAAVYGLFRTLGLSARRSEGWTAVLALTGFFLQHTVYTWPKMAAGALACGAFACWVLLPPAQRSWRSVLTGAALAALAWLAHGGVAFSFLVLVPWVMVQCFRDRLRHWLGAVLIFTVFAAPWMAYQKFYDPPGNRLLKWHLGGQTAKDGRGVWQTIRENYAASTWEEIRERKKINFIAQVAGDWRNFFDFGPEGSKERRRMEFFHPSRALGWWIAAAALLPLVWRRLARDPVARPIRRMHVVLALWTLLTIPLWCLLLFGVGAVIHQGSFAVMIVGFVLLSAWFERAGRWWLPFVGIAQAATFVTTWAGGTDLVGGQPETGALILSAISALALAGMVGRAMLDRDAQPAPMETAGRA